MFIFAFLKMGAFQSKVWSEVASSASPGSPSESEPVSNIKKPAAPFRDPRSASDGVDRTPIQFSEDRQGKVPSTDQTPTGLSLAGRFKVRSKFRLYKTRVENSG